MFIFYYFYTHFLRLICINYKDAINIKYYYYISNLFLALVVRIKILLNLTVNDYIYFYSYKK